MTLVLELSALDLPRPQRLRRAHSETGLGCLVFRLCR
jgi:hypothetical protein